MSPNHPAETPPCDRTYALHDVDIAQCTAADAGTDTCVLTYQSVGP